MMGQASNARVSATDGGASPSPGTRPGVDAVGTAALPQPAPGPLPVGPAHPGVSACPLVVDLDGTLTPTDTLVESLILAVHRSPGVLWRLPGWLMAGRSVLKQALASRASIDVATLPYHRPLLDYLAQERSKGRRIVLATAAHEDIAARVAQHLGLFDQVLASTAGHNLKGAAKLAAIRREVGESFVYAGDSAADLAVWNAAQGAVLVGVPSRIASRMDPHVPIERTFRRPDAGAADWLSALRLHQWSKNLLLFVPLLTAMSEGTATRLGALLLAFLSFGLAASATYIVNDLWDLQSDRAHPRKRNRPFARAALPISHGLVVAAVGLAMAFGIALGVSWSFTVLLAGYLVLTSAYSWWLKRYVLLDTLALALLYTLRILAGSAVLGTYTSAWLLAFSVFIFFSLALVKRCAELVTLQAQGVSASHGRDYRVADLQVLWPLGAGSALAAVVVFGLFVSAGDTQARYATPELLWLVAFGLIYWLGRLWIKVSRGEMHDDPVVYALRDRGSRTTMLVIVALVLAARFVALRWAA